MFKVNLEKELVKKNQVRISAEELLILQETDRIGIVENDSLDRIGIGVLKEGKELKEKLDTAKKQTLRFNQDRVFHVSQIEKLCNQYYLRFLPAALFKGAIDKELPSKISQFEMAYNVECYSTENSNGWEGSLYTPFRDDENNITHMKAKRNNTYIMAPKQSFKLEERPKDPLLFYKINDEYYYLIHKWGNDLSVFRRVRGLFNEPITYFCLPLIACFIYLLFYINTTIQGYSVGKFICDEFVIYLIQAFAIFTLWLILDFRFANEWNSRIE